MIHYVYTTARGLCRIVHAQTPTLAWLMACARHSPQLLLDLDGAAWAESVDWLPIRVKDSDVEPAHARRLYFTACLAEMPATSEEMPRAAVGKWIAPGLQRLLVTYGLAEHDAADFRLTDLGRAFAAWIQGRCEVMHVAATSPKRTVHMAGKIAEDGGVSARCFAKPRKIDMSRETWTTDPAAVTCPGCKAKIGGAS